MRLTILFLFAIFAVLTLFFITNKLKLPLTDKRESFNAPQLELKSGEDGAPINNTIPKILPNSSTLSLLPSAGADLQSAPQHFPPPSHLIPQKLHVFQTFNNCGPASLSMLLSYFEINKSQDELGERLRPYQNTQGDNDDKSVTLQELASAGKEYGLVAYHRPNGNIELLKQFIAAEIPVITRTLLSGNEDIGHYRLIRGYNDEEKILIQDDSFQGKNLTYTYEEFNSLWKNFNYEYLVLVPVDKKILAEKIIGEDVDENKAWKKTVSNTKKILSENPDDIFTRFNLSVALYHSGEHEQSIFEYEKVADQLPFRTLWYQIEPIQAYAKLGIYDKVFILTDKILNNANRAFSELYLIRGKIYQEQGQPGLAHEEFQKALFYNQNLKDAKDTLSTF